MSVEVSVEDVFSTLLKVRENEFPERDPRDFGLLLYDGVISDEEFVLLYNETLVERFVTRKRMFVASLSLFAIYVLPHFPTLHSS